MIMENILSDNIEDESDKEDYLLDEDL